MRTKEQLKRDICAAIDRRAEEIIRVGEQIRAEVRGAAEFAVG